MKVGQMSVLCSYFQDDCGVTAIEYALIASLIFLAIIGAVGSVGSKVTGLYTSVANSL